MAPEVQVPSEPADPAPFASAGHTQLPAVPQLPLQPQPVPAVSILFDNAILLKKVTIGVILFAGLYMTTYSNRISLFR